MAKSLSLIAAGEKLGIFECPNCKQTIDASAAQCRFCFATINPIQAQAAAEKMARINQACSDASFLRTAAISVLVFLGIMFVPFFGLLGIVGYYFLLIAVPFLSIRWWIRFHGIRTDDRDFRRARMIVIIVSVLIAIPILNSLVHFF
jgi:hypothetical protein